MDYSLEGVEYQVDRERGEDEQGADEPQVGVDVLPVGLGLGEGVGQDDVLEGRHGKHGVVLKASDLERIG